MKATPMRGTSERLFPEEAETCSSDGAARPPCADILEADILEADILEADILEADILEAELESARRRAA